MRGKAAKILKELEASGITPAYAGKRSFWKTRCLTSEDHPRLCGEKVFQFYALHLICGITPAYAGKRRNEDFVNTKFEDHPRLCGEKFSSSHHSIYQIGSPPPMRGKVSFGVVEDILDRITPAYAGKSD